MQYVWLASWKPSVTRVETEGALSRRAQWQYPDGAKVLGEYWLSGSSPAVVVIFEADSYGPIMELQMTWGDVFDITCVPATTPEEGLKLGAAILQRRPG